MPRTVVNVRAPSRPTGGPPATRDPAWVRAIFLAPAVVGSFAALVVIGQARAGVRRLRRQSADQDRLAASIVGQSRRRVTARFGTPPAATSAPAVTWYYPLPDAPTPTAMAVWFDGETATRVEFLRPPG